MPCRTLDIHSIRSVGTRCYGAYDNVNLNPQNTRKCNITNYYFFHSIISTNSIRIHNQVLININNQQKSLQQTHHFINQHQSKLNKLIISLINQNKKQIQTFLKMPHDKTTKSTWINTKKQTNPRMKTSWIDYDNLKIMKWKHAMKIDLKKWSGVSDVVTNGALSSDTDLIFVDGSFRFGFFNLLIPIHGRERKR